jgi:CRP/FNR family transcriptional regulator
VCAALSADELARLREITTELRAAPRQTIFHEGDPADHLFNVTGGAVRLFKLLPDGRRQITGFLFPGDFLGFAMNDSYAFTAEAITEVSLCRFPRLKLEALLDQFPKMERRLLGMASNELAAAQDQMLLLGRKTAEEKVASFLLLLSRRATERGQPEDPISLPMTRSDIGDCLGLTIETVSRILTRLKKSGVIAMTRNDMVSIGRRDELHRIAEAS